MNIACISCPARYAVPDAKLTGKRVRIRCKRCGATLLVDGTVRPPRITSADGAGSSVPPARTSLQPLASRPPQAAQAAPFLVNFSDGHQENADVVQIVRLYRDQRMDAETLVWKDGMAEWAAPWDVPEIAGAFQRMGYAPPEAATGEDDDAPSDEDSTHVVPSSRPGRAMFDDDEATHVVDSSRFAEESEAALRAQAAFTAVGEGDDDPTHVVSSPVERAAVEDARRASRGRADRGAQRASGGAAVQTNERSTARARTREAARSRQEQPDGLDLFEARARAEQELAPAVDEGSHLTGARGENSVLFSLDQLVQKERAAQRPLVLPQRARTDESVLVDSAPSLPSSAGGFGSLVAPDFTAPISAPPPAALRPVLDEAELPQKRSRGWIYVLAFFAVSGAAGFAYSSGRLDPLLVSAGLKKPEPEPAAKQEATSNEAREAKEPEAEASAEPETSAEPGASASPSASASAGSQAPSPAGRPTRETPRSTAEPKPATKGEAKTESTQEEAAKPSGGGAFDTGAARSTLSAAAGKAGSCRSPGGATGTGRVTVTFAPSGRPTSVAVSGDLAGTPVGSCVAKIFRATQVPSFSGSAVTVSKAFSVQ